MLRGRGTYRIERWFAGGVPLVSVQPVEATAPLPVVTIYHRFSGRNTDDLLRLALPLADSGVAAVLPESALHGERAPQDFERRLADDRDGLFTDVLEVTVREAAEVFDWISSREELDPSRIGVIGTSMGGAVALAVSCGHHSPAPKVSVALMPTAPGPKSTIRQEAAYSPRPELCFPTALMIVHGTEDRTAPYPNARSFYDTLVPHYSAAPERLRFVDMPGEDHRVGAYWIEETLSWLGRFL
ncbi:abhydrolase domain-containing 18 [Rubrobacter tropicus]|uniref:Abhydrolase domain-containing 18 n=1 Tax=Rubrobacter tropicus TaxID=2653851 RepID=A0A6G8Q7M2_9ACTN|nr:prolyl oligopeptidase family serine peptidase [Rubrobacter tropicus]QIN82460.1 abhydrolase domain-containing 18 [Rubrobacter tropicus]